jgi:protein disulfide-isomerase A6
MRFSLPLFLSVLAAGASASNVLDLGPDNFDNVIGKGKPALVEL